MIEGIIKSKFKFYKRCKNLEVAFANGVFYVLKI